MKKTEPTLYPKSFRLRQRTRRLLEATAIKADKAEVDIVDEGIKAMARRYKVTLDE